MAGIGGQSAEDGGLAAATDEEQVVELAELVAMDRSALHIF